MKMTSSYLAALDAEWKSDNERAVEWAEKQVKLCMEDPEMHRRKSELQIAARWLYENKDTHQCYGNDRFAIAVMCNLSIGYKRRAAWALIANGKSGFFQWVTQGGYKMAEVFNYLGIEFSEATRTISIELYTDLSQSVSQQLAVLFDLPTTEFNPQKKTLTRPEQKWRAVLNNLHPHTSLR